MTGEPKAAIQNLGCSKNQIDGERIMALLAAGGYGITEDCAQADVIVVNTCAFIREAQEEAIEAVLEMAALRKSGRCKTLVVSGCFSERYRDKVKKEFPEVDIWAGVGDWEAAISPILYNNKDNVSDSPSGESYIRALSAPLSTQYIKIAEGCSHRCSFCVIPSIRGRFKSRGEESIIQEARWLYEQGARELILVAQDTSYYGRDAGASLARLLESLLKNTDFPWIRMMYLHPQLIDDGLLKLVAAEGRVCPYFDIPLQHISDPILAAMNRQPLSGGIRALIDRIRGAVGGAALRTSFIVGFPGETEKEFGELRRFVESARFDKLGVFPFSPEEGTPAFSMRPRPRAGTVRRRCEELMEIQREISRELLEAKVGGSAEIIIDRISDDHDFNYEARTRADAPEVDGRVFVGSGSGSFETGQILNVRITGASDYDLYAEVEGVGGSRST